MMLSKIERRKQGKALREKCPRTSLAEWKPRSKSHDPIKLLEESDADRIPGLIPLRYERMSESPFKFYRGTAIIQARDLANSAVSGITVQACGDCHLMNFGGYTTPERTLVFDINDLDETFPGPWEWDVKRLGASLVLAARDRSFSKQIAADAVRAAVASYRERMSDFADESVLGTWYARVTFDDLLEFFRKDKDLLNRLKTKVAESRSRTSEAAFPKLSEVVDGRRRIKDNPPVIYHFHEKIRDFEKQSQGFREEYRKTLRSASTPFRTKATSQSNMASPLMPRIPANVGRLPSPTVLPSPPIPVVLPLPAMRVKLPLCAFCVGTIGTTRASWISCKVPNRASSFSLPSAAVSAVT
jgi:Uncharacterized protein conserved in bacteria (DUF2252)